MERFKKHLQAKYNLSNEDWDIVKDYAEPLYIRKNEYFVKYGKVCRRLGFIAEGVMRFCMEREGEDITCYFASENEFAGDPDSFFGRIPSDKNIQALTDCTLISLSVEHVFNLYKACPNFEAVMKLIDHDVLMGLMIQRDFLQHADATSKYKKFIEQYPHILQRVPLSYVASFLGITQQSLSRLRKRIS